jgi:hypothetical protein
VTVDGKRLPPVRVRADELYTLASFSTAGDHLLDLSFEPGTEAYAFTFG